MKYLIIIFLLLGLSAHASVEEIATAPAFAAPTLEEVATAPQTFAICKT